MQWNVCTWVLQSCHTDLGNKNNIIQWTPSNPATIGTRQSVLIRGVASFHFSSNPITLGTNQSVLI